MHADEVALRETMVNPSVSRHELVRARGVKIWRKRKRLIAVAFRILRLIFPIAITTIMPMAIL